MDKTKKQNREEELKIKKIEREISEERRKNGFFCLHCHTWVSLNAVGTKHRNHCPKCLWSRHMGKLERLSNVCSGEMSPVGLTFKKEGIDKYTKKPRRGEIMIIHRCNKCGKISINRLAGDDDPEAVMRIFRQSFRLPKRLSKQLKTEKIEILSSKDEKEIKRQLGVEG